ncbi:MAG: efflux RND transporter periplasmic adaptor subunit [Gemmataceae bacterium]|nr:efflux RND transporter periplasmic adaptor subunit [Gemmataceae bacterium]
MMNALVRMKVVGLVGILAFAGCRQPQKDAKGPGGMPAPPVTVIRPIIYPVQSYYEYAGNLEPVETVQIVARVKGFLNDIRFTEGEEVKKGQLLFKIDPRELQAAFQKAEADRIKAIAEARRARSELERGQQLAQSRALSSEELEQRVAAKEVADAVIKQAEAGIEAAKLELSYTDITAPIDGRISRALITRGNLVGQADSSMLTTIVSMDPLFVFFDAPERDLVEYQRSLQKAATSEGVSRKFPVEIGVTGEQGFPHVGFVDFRENRVDISSGTVRIRGRIPNPKVPPGNERLLYPGLYAKVRVPAGAPKTLPVVPEDALLTGQEGRYVYVLGEKNIVRKRTVIVGEHVFRGKETTKEEIANGWRLKGDKNLGPTAITSVVAIEKGLTTDDVVIVNGIARARPGTPVAPEERTFEGPELKK